MPYAPINGINAYYETHGAGEAVVFAHGVGGNHLSWWQQVPTFARDHTAIAFDHRGFGASPDAPNGPGQTAFVDDLRALLDHLGIRAAHLVAQSMGGWTCLGFAAQYPDRVHSLVMADSLGGLAHPALQAAAAPLRATWNALHPHTRTMSDGFRARNPDMAYLYGAVRRINPLRSESPMGAGPTVAEVLRANVPTMFLVGALDPLVPPALARQAQALLPGSRFVEVPDAGHSVYWEQPARFNRTVLAWMRKHAGRCNGPSSI